MKRDRHHGKPSQADQHFEAGMAMVRAHPLFGRLVGGCSIYRGDKSYCPRQGHAVVVDRGTIHVHPKRVAEPAEWAYAIAHALLHLCFEHFRPRPRPEVWNAACCTVVKRFLDGVKIGRAPMELATTEDVPGGSEETLYRDWCDRGAVSKAAAPGLAGEVPDLWFAHDRAGDSVPEGRWSERFATAIRQAVAAAVTGAGERAAAERHETRGTRARDWVLQRHPLLASLAMAFEIVEEPATLAALDVAIGAVDESARRIYLNTARLDDEEARFVMAHEILHVALRHELRCQGRDPFLWNVACDYVINGWLIEMGMDRLPAVGALHDPSLRGLSAEAIYDRLVTDLRRLRKLCTLRGMGLPDVISAPSTWWSGVEGLRLDELYRRCLADGLAYHAGGGRGLLPAGLLEEIRALAQPPIPWDVELARWFDRWFSPLELRRSYARPSRRQSSTPDIPRPSVVVRDGVADARTFGVILDTSGSMDVVLLGRALGAIASYALSRDVPAARVVFCDAAAYDAGYLPVEAIAGRVRVRGRGGTVLQPAVELLETAGDFPRAAPILVITDGECDRMQLRRSHAFLIPANRSLPFRPVGPVFRVQ